MSLSDCVMGRKQSFPRIKPSPVFSSMANGKQTRTNKTSLCRFRQGLPRFGFSSGIAPTECLEKEGSTWTTWEYSAEGKEETPPEQPSVYQSYIRPLFECATLAWWNGRSSHVRKLQTKPCIKMACRQPTNTKTTFRLHTWTFRTENTRGEAVLGHRLFWGKDGCSGVLFGGQPISEAHDSGGTNWPAQIFIQHPYWYFNILMPGF